jgi:hypothetical protein
VPHAIVQRESPETILHDEQYFTSVLARARSAIRDALAGPAKAIEYVAYAEHPVHEFASNRRIIDGENKCHIRFSIATHDEKIRQAPEGVIDPMMSLVVFYDEQKRPVASWSFYASHPQVSSDRPIISGDTIGVAMDLFEKAHPGLAPVYFTGCAGDVTAGKYTTANLDRNRLVFGIRLFDAMQAAFENARPVKLESIAWLDRVRDVPLAKVQQERDALLPILRDPASTTKEKYQAAMKLDRLERRMDRYPFRASRLTINDDIHIVFLPTELLLEYQLYAKRRIAGRVAVAAYGDSFLKYVATDEMFPQGGYEVRDSTTEVGPGIESAVKDIIDDILLKQPRHEQ